MAARPYYIRFKPSASADVIQYRIFITPKGVPVEADTPYIDINAPFVIEPDGKIQIDIQPLYPDLDGTYDVDIVAVDDAGNPSPALEGVMTVDFVVPDAPTEIEFVSG